MLATRKGARRETRSEGSVVQNRGPMNKNRIRGWLEGTSARRSAKSISIKTPASISGGHAVKVVELTPGELRRCPKVGTEEVERRPHRGAEVSRGRSSNKKPAAGTQARVKRGRFMLRRPERCPAGCRAG